MIGTSVLKGLFQKFDELDNGKRICFKRNCGKALREVDANTLLEFYRLINGEATQWDEDKIFAALCVHSLWDAKEMGRVPFDEAVAMLKSVPGEISDSFMKRVSIIMDTEWDNNGVLVDKIIRMAKYLRQKGTAIDGASLAEDLIHWNDFSKTVQKRWARTLCKQNLEYEKGE